MLGQLVVRKLDDDVKVRLQQRAKRNGRSLEAEVREILSGVVAAEAAELGECEGFGTRMHRHFAEGGLTKEESSLLDEAIEEVRRGSMPREPGLV